MRAARDFASRVSDSLKVNYPPLIQILGWEVSVQIQPDEQFHRISIFESLL